VNKHLSFAYEKHILRSSKIGSRKKVVSLAHYKRVLSVIISAVWLLWECLYSNFYHKNTLHEIKFKDRK
jgi:hypothetical protein